MDTQASALHVDIYKRGKLSLTCPISEAKELLTLGNEPRETRTSN